MKRKLLLFMVFICTLLVRQNTNAQTTLAAGDVAFIGYQTSVSAPGGDGFSFITLKDMAASTIVYFTERGWGNGTWITGSTESHLVWNVPSFTPAGTIISVVEDTAGTGFVVTGTTGIGYVSGFTGFNLASGDQILAYQSTTAPVAGANPGNTPTFIAGVHGDYNSGDYDTTTTWNTTAATGGPSSSLPQGLTNGLNCVSLFPGVVESANSKYTGTLTGTKATLLTSINNPANWGHHSTNDLGIIPSGYPTPSVTVVVAPTVTSTAATGIGAISATLGGNVTADGGDTVTERGIVWSTSANPTTANNKVSNGSGTGSFSGITIGFPVLTTIHFRAYAINSIGTSYGSNLTFTTNPSLGASTTNTNVACNGASTGTANVVAFGGKSPYNYSWSPSGGSGAIATSLAAGNYTVTITDSEGTQITKSFTITQPLSALSTSSTSQTNISCNGGANGTATVVATGGTPNYTYSWAPTGGTAATATGLVAGTYSVTMTDANSCQITRSFTITQPSAALSTTSTSQTNVSCNGGTNGTATVVVSGGTPSYTYSWAPSGGTSATATGLSAGTYTVTITDANSCQITRSFTITQPTSALSTSSTSQTNVSCNGGNNGAATVAVAGGTPSYTYSWSPSGGSGATASGLSAGTYTVTITDANSCQITRSFTITQPQTLTATTSQIDAFCNTGGQASVNVSGGTTPYTYSWSPSGGTEATASNLAVGTYTVTIQDNNSCQLTKTFTIINSSTLTATKSQTDVSCNGGSNGTATVLATGGTAPYSYSWSPSGGTGATASGLTAGTYTVTISDSAGCSITKTFTITQPSALVAATSQTNIACNGLATGSASVLVTGGTASYTYLWSPSGGSADTATSLTAGNYTVTITDTNTCQITKSFTVTEPTTLTASLGIINNVSCNGGANGTATVNVTGGTPGYTYSWSPSGGTAATATGLTEGSYTVTVTDANSCQTTQSFAITQPSALVASASAQTDVTCNGGANGTATVSVTGGAPSYTYLWAPTGGTAATATGLVAGTYTVTVKDANTCQTTQSFTITQPPVLNATASAQTNIACNGGTTGSATVAVTGGTGTYTYSWAPTGGSSATATGLAAGTYTVTVTDANGCTDTQSFTLTQPPVLVTSAGTVTNVTCNGGANGSATVIVLGGTPGYTYSWAPSGGSSATATGLAAGTYTVTVTDVFGCQTTRNFTINQPPALVASFGAQTNISCNGGANGSATVSVTGGTPNYAYIWAPSGGTAATATGLVAGTYTVTVKDANNCQTTQSFTITQPASLTATTSQTNVLCNGSATGSATVTPSGGTASYTYLWSPSGGTASTASGLAVGNYSCLITDTNGCSITKNFTITQPPVLSATTSQTNATCATPGQATVTPSGGTAPYFYLWSNGDTTATTTSGLTSGNYSCLITDSNGCTLTKNFIISTTNTLVATQSQSNILCNGGNTGSATVVPSGAVGPFTYAWSPSGGNADTASGLTAGNYSVTITAGNGCSIVKNFTITEPTTIAITPSQINVTCNGGSNGSATVNTTGGTGSYTYLWAPSGGTASTAIGLPAGTYTVTVKDANLCQTTQNFTITQPAALVASVGSQTNVSCNGGANGSATVAVTSGTGSYTYLWAPSGGTAATASGLAAGTYTVTVKDTNLCQTTQSFTITEPTVLTTTASQTNILCNGGATGSATVATSGGTAPYTYSWSPSGGTAATATGLTIGTYTCTITDSKGCFITKSVTLTQPAALIASAAAQSNVSCNSGSNGTASINVTGGTPGYTYSWTPSGASTPTANGLTAGNYTAMVTDANGCTASQSFTITQPNALTATTSQTNVSCFGANNGSASVVVAGGTGAHTYSWSPSGGTAATASNITAGNYTVTITDANNCQITKSFTITQPSALTATMLQTDVSCNGGTNGSATVNVTGGTSGYTYLWSPSGGSGATASNLAAGNYSVTIIDANNCQITKNFTITQPTSLTATTSQTNVLCNGAANGMATVNVSGGTGSYTYSWAPAGGTAATASGLIAGNYTVTITDANSCQITRNFTITQPSTLTTTVSQTNVSCKAGSNGTATVVTSGGTGSYTYLWAPTGGTAATASNLNAGSYTVTITDANSCKKTESFTISEPANAVNLNTSTATNVTVSSATLSGIVSSDGINRDKGQCLTETGFVYATHSNPSITDTKINISNALGNITTSLTGLKGNTTYYVKAYAINSSGFVNYGNEISFTTDKYKLIITASIGFNKVYGTSDPIFTYTATGFANGDTKAIITGALSRDPGENVGKYNINIGNINVGSNYIIEFTGAFFEITKADQIITWNQNLEFGCDTGNQTVLSATSTSGLPISYSIANTDIGEITGTTLKTKNPGSSTITAVQNGDQNYNPAISVVKPILVSQPGLIIQQWSDVLLSDNKNKNFVSWQWFKNGTAVSGATRQYYSESQPLNGTYYVIAKDKNGTSIKSCPLDITGTTFSKTLRILPNPVKALNEFTLECNFSESQLNGATITIFDLSGKLIQTISSVKTKNQITAPSQSALYIIVLNLSNGSQKTINLLVN